MTNDSDVDADDDGHVIVSFTILAATPIAGLAKYLHQPRIRDDEFFYDLGMESFQESEASVRAARLDTAINGFLDLVDSVDRNVLHDSTSFVRLFMTLGRGAETIAATTLKRLADVNTTIWIDA